MEHAYDLANQGYNFKKRKFTIEELYEIMEYGNLSKEDYHDLLLYQDVDESFLIKYTDVLRPYLESYSYHFKLTDNFIRHLSDLDILTYDFIRNQDISDETMIYILEANDRENIKYINDFIQQREVSHTVITTYLDYIDFKLLFKYQEISEEFCVDIFHVTGDDKKIHQMFSVGAVYQDWSDAFIERFKQYVDWYKYNVYPERVRIPYEKMTYFIDDDPNGYHPDDIEWPILSDDTDPKLIEVNNKNVTPEEWKIKIQAEYPSYGIEDDHFFGFITCYKDGYDLENFAIKYEDGNTYHRHSDMTNTPNSFGLTIRTLNECKAIKEDVRIIRPDLKKIIVVKVYFSDVVYAQKTVEGYSIRVKNMTVFGNYNGY